MSTTPLPDLNRQIATTQDGIDITRGYVGPLLTPYDSVLRQRGSGDLLIYEQVLSDPEVKSTFSQRQLAVTQCEWQVDAGGDAAIDTEAADSLRDNLHTLGWDNITTKMLFGVFYGYSAAEVVYARRDSRVVIDKLLVRNRRRFRYGKEGDLRLLTMNNMFEGVPAPAPYFWNFCTGADHDDEPYGLGLAHWLYWPVLFKRNGLKFWLIFLEKYAAPTAVGTYNASTATPEEKSALLSATRAIQTDSGIIIPEGMLIELLEAKRSGTSDYQALQDAMNASIQKVVLGQTASTQGTPGRLGNDDLQGDVRADIIKADADLVCESFNLGPARWLTEWNFPGAKIPRVYRITEEPEDLTERADRDTKVKALGFKPSLKYIHDTYGEEWEEAAEPDSLADPNASSSVPGATVPSAAAAQFAAPQTEPDAAARMTDQLGRDLSAPVNAWLAQVRAVLDETIEQGLTLSDFRDKVLELYPRLTLDEYAQLMATASSAAHLAGRSEAQDSVQLPPEE